MDVLQVRNISFNYSDKAIIKDLSFDERKGDFI